MPGRSQGPNLILASASPRRREILQAMGLDFKVAPSPFDESTLRAMSPRRQAAAAARGKARAVHASHPDAWVIGADTVVELDGRALGKPVDSVDAERMLRLLSGRTHSVISALYVVAPDGEDALGDGISQVRVESLSPDRIRAYVASAEPFDKAGAYAIQGGAGEFASLSRGRVDTVVGLPTHVLRRLLRQVGFPRSANLGRLR